MKEPGKQVHRIAVYAVNGNKSGDFSATTSERVNNITKPRSTKHPDHFQINPVKTITRSHVLPFVNFP